MRKVSGIFFLFLCFVLFIQNIYTYIYIYIICVFMHKCPDSHTKFGMLVMSVERGWHYTLTRLM